MARNKHPEETKNLIIDTAARLFMDQGYDHTSIQDIINHLGGLSKGAIYHHFKSKEEIMWEVAEKIYAGSRDEIMKVCARTDLNGKEKLKEIFRSSASHPAQKDMFSAAPDMLYNSQLLVLFLRGSVQKEAPEMIYGVLEEGIADGSIKAEYPKELSEVIMLLVNFWLNPMIYHCETEEMIKKIRFCQHLLQLMGLDIVDDSLISKLVEYVALYNQNRQEQNS